MPEQASGYFEVDLSSLASKVGLWGQIDFVFWMLGFKESKGIEAITHESCEDSDPLILIRILQYSSSGSH